MLLFRARKTLRDELEPPHVHGALFPLATLLSRVEAFSLTPRVAGAVGAAVVAVSVSVSVPALGRRRPGCREPGSARAPSQAVRCRTRGEARRAARRRRKQAPAAKRRSPEATRRGEGVRSPVAARPASLGRAAAAAGRRLLQPEPAAAAQPAASEPEPAP